MKTKSKDSKKLVQKMEVYAKRKVCCLSLELQMQKVKKRVEEYQKRYNALELRQKLRIQMMIMAIGILGFTVMLILSPVRFKF